ncbi:HEPN/Toprim-associated domain-containing protein [Undibacterium sp. Tian12W]|uniref:HEPN/Toprim-associated domain-containing protein n=1 Tax=Undibacterium sp. Tian12W TaxID=3413054 RepID=UPI003BF3F921
MGSFSGLNLGPFSITESKNEFVSHHRELFQEQDLVISPLHGFTEPEEHYERPLRLVLERLELLGHTLERARQEFENPNPYSLVDPLPLSFDQVMDVLRTVDVSKLNVGYTDVREIGKIAPLDIQQLIATVRPPDQFENDHWDLDALIENFDPYTLLRIFAENPVNLELPVIWYFDEVVQAGWIERDEIQVGLNKYAAYLLVTEGSSDAKILRHAFEVLRPNISAFFRFVDMADGYPFTGTGNLVNFAKGLVSIHIQNNVVFIFDNDAEGVASMNKCNAFALPGNMKMMKLPDLDAFKRFPTIGPQGPSLDDINGRGAAIECYLDLPENACVRWSNYNEALGVYQGALEHKDKYKKEFLSLNGRVESYDYQKLECILDAIIEVCVSITTQS